MQSLSSRERDLAASGGAPDDTDREPSEEWRTIETGIEMRHLKGTKYYRAVTQLDDPAFPGEQGPLYSKEYRACDEADPVPVTAYAHVNPQAEQHRREVNAAVARSHMKPDEAALSDMRKLAKELENNLSYPYYQWQQKLARHARRLESTADIREQVDTMLLDIAEHGMIPEYEQFIEQLRMLMKGVK